MIQVQDLRLGNIVNNYEGIPKKVILEDFAIFNEFPFKLHDITPVQLTQEWLEKLGFCFDPEDTYKTHLNMAFQDLNIHIFIAKGQPFKLQVSNNEDPLSYTDIDLINEVHRLQNVVHSLTGKEL